MYMELFHSKMICDEMKFEDDLQGQESMTAFPLNAPDTTGDEGMPPSPIALSQGASTASNHSLCIVDDSNLSWISTTFSPQ